jgi:stage II sporulation protein D
MYRRAILIIIVCILSLNHCLGQVRIRLFSSRTPETAVFTSTSGPFALVSHGKIVSAIQKNEPVVISRFKGRLAVKPRKRKGFICDSIKFTGVTGRDYFSLRINDGAPLVRRYSGELTVYPDLGTLVMINSCDVESYIAGVVKAEGGQGRNREYIKTQAILARTYMYKYFNKHLADRYNVCDNTHCQAFYGLPDDSVITRATLDTKDLVILDKDNVLIVSAFHSNCGGETSSPGDVWLTETSYLRKVTDPYCLSSHNASWTRTLSLKEWVTFLRKSGFKGDTSNPAVFNFSQKTRQTTYRVGSFSVPLGTIREELNLKSTFFSVIASGDSVILKGRGYGHGVGLCQEGAMTMAKEGHDFRQIISFYYTDVIITNIKNAVFLPGNHNPVITGGGL